MPVLLDVCYLLFLLLISPWLIYKSFTTGKYRRGLVAKFFGPQSSYRDGAKNVVWFHGVSVGEIHLLRPVLSSFRKHNPQATCVVSATTDTGFDEARRTFPDLEVFWFPLDFSWSVGRALRHVGPTLLVLAEGELWPNLLLAARRRGVPVAVINARMSPRSAGRYHRLAGLARPLVRSLAAIGAQTADYAAEFRSLGARPDRVHTTGNVKFDGVVGDRGNLKTRDLRQLFDIGAGELVWVAGSTQAPEEEIVLGIFQRLRRDYPTLRLLLVPRQKDRFAEVAGLLQRSGQPFARRTELASAAERRATMPGVVLVDTIGELGAVWGLADVAYVGGSLDGKRGGQNMIEPAAYGAAVVFGPHVWNFRDTAERLVRAEAARQVRDGSELEGIVHELLGNAAERARLGEAARDFVSRQQGATERTVAMLGELLQQRRTSPQAA
jgi:3-deoxy-D-manno-octulosonic-acid transferase